MSCRFEPEDSQLALDLAHCAEQAAELANCAIHAMAEVSQIRDAIDSGDWKWMWDSLQTVLDRYGSLIHLLSPITNISLVHLTREEIARLTVDDLVFQLRIATGFIFVHYACKSACKLVFKEHFFQLTKSLIPSQRHLNSSSNH